MPSQIDEVLSRHTGSDAGPPATREVVLTPHGKITAYFTARAVTLGLGGGLGLALAGAALFHGRTGSGVMGMIGLGLVIWAVATAVIVLAVGSVPYFSVKRRVK